MYSHLINMEFIRAEIFRDLDSSCTQVPDISNLHHHIKQTQECLDNAFNPYFGGLFRSGSKQTFFSMQVLRYADIYASDFLNLLHYPLFYYFSAIERSVPHEFEFQSNEELASELNGR
mmetsp:Transcript_48751/g.81138  ORF Transcript_48751/g.81138 Transcript_48751/m.81138 type:complete len:118 (-) Transcript_48751:383-736(-)